MKGIQKLFKEPLVVALPAILIAVGGNWVSDELKNIIEGTGNWFFLLVSFIIFFLGFLVIIKFDLIPVRVLRSGKTKGRKAVLLLLSPINRVKLLNEDEKFVCEFQSGTNDTQKKKLNFIALTLKIG